MAATGADPVRTASSPTVSGGAVSPFIRWMSLMARPAWEAGSSRRKSYQGSSSTLDPRINPWRTAR